MIIIFDIFDYINQTKNISFDQLPLNELDAAIFSQLIYLNFEIFPSNEKGKLKDLNKENTINKLTARTWQPEKNKELIKKISTSQRYMNVIWSNFKKVVDLDKQEQFAAISFLLKNNTSFLAFRGTRATFIGWKENLNMLYLPFIPSQLSAVKYFNLVSNQQSQNFYLGGHSKGGNLATFIALTANVTKQAQIKKVFNFDGPGFNETTQQKLNYSFYTGKIEKIIPQESLFGVLFENKQNFKVINSCAHGISQHDIFTWQVNFAATTFQQATHLSLLSLNLQDCFKDTIVTYTPELCKQWIETFYSLLESTGCKSFNELSQEKLYYTFYFLMTFSNVQSAQKRNFLRGITIFIRFYFRSIYNSKI